MSKHWLAPMALALFCAGSGWNTTASAQDADAQDNKLVYGDRVIGHMTQTGGGASESRIILHRIDGGLVQEHRSWAAQPGLPCPFHDLEGTSLPAIAAAPEIPSVIPSGALANLPALEPSPSDLRVSAARQAAASGS